MGIIPPVTIGSLTIETVRDEIFQFAPVTQVIESSITQSINQATRNYAGYQQNNRQGKHHLRACAT